jgi:hypothetical protein
VWTRPSRDFVPDSETDSRLVMLKKLADRHEAVLVCPDAHLRYRYDRLLRQPEW